jgi:superfamily II DNA or RNA helicase
MASPQPAYTGLPSSLCVDVDDLSPVFDTATIARGVQYARQARIRDLAWDPDGATLTGSCAGSRGYVYDVRVGFEDDGAVLLQWAKCTCPVGHFCKHAVALVLTVANDAPPPAEPDQWRTIFTRVLDEVPACLASAGAPVGLEFSLTAPSRYRPGGMVALRPVTIGQRGTWIKRGMSWQRILYGYGLPADEFDSRQYGAIRALITALGRYSPVGASDPLVISEMPAELWPQLIAAQDAGVSLVADKSSGLRAVELIKNAQLRLDFTADDSGGATMSVALIVDGAQTGPAGVGLIGRPAPHGMHQVADGVLRLGAFDPAPGPTVLGLLAHGRSVHIPADSVDEFAVSTLPRLSDAVPVDIEDGLFAPPAVTGPMPVLTVTMTHTGARAYWSTRYEVNDKHHDFDPGSPARSSGYRDAGAEDTAWHRVKPALRAVATASHTYKQQAARHVKQRMARVLDGALVRELSALNTAGDTAAAAAAASTATLRGAVDLTAVEAAVLCGEVLPGLACADDLVVEIDENTPDFHPAGTDPKLEFGSGGEPEQTDWFDLNITVQVDEHHVPLSDVIAELATGATHMLLPSGVYFRLDTAELARLRQLIDEARALGEIDGDTVNARSLNVTLWDELLSLGVVDEQLARWRQNLARLGTARPPVPIEVPGGLDATLRDYQRDGLDWLSFLWDNNLGGILADDMGLGKTVQTLALIARSAAAGAGKFLVVAPTSVVGNWIAECHRFTPNLNAVAVVATDARADSPLSDLAADADIVVTSYTLLRIDFETYNQINWAGAILDEAQFVKNHNSKTHQSVRRLEAGFKLAITGTPMENNLMELWSLLSITAPGLFPSPKAFGDYFRKPIESGTDRERLPVLRRRIKPVMLRRTKTQVVAELPPKQEQALTIDLDAKHRKVYDTRLARERQKVLGLLGDWEKNRFRIFRSLTLLRQLSLHPGLVDATHLGGGSAKIGFLVGQLPQLVSEGHSALVFSQFTGFLAILRSHLDAAGVAYSYLDGSVDARGREAALASFGDGINQVFLISLKAGGFGLNLTSADYCFLCDPWWSPAAEAQAVDRTHRIGQTRPVSVYRLVSADTIEEKVVALQQRKRELFAAVMDEGELFSSAITAADVRELLG